MLLATEKGLSRIENEQPERPTYRKGNFTIVRLFPEYVREEKNFGNSKTTIAIGHGDCPTSEHSKGFYRKQQHIKRLFVHRFIFKRGTLLSQRRSN